MPALLVLRPHGVAVMAMSVTSTAITRQPRSSPFSNRITSFLTVPLGVVAIVFAKQVNTYAARGEYGKVKCFIRDVLAISAALTGYILGQTTPSVMTTALSALDTHRVLKPYTPDPAWRKDWREIWNYTWPITA